MSKWAGGTRGVGATGCAKGRGDVERAVSAGRANKLCRAR